MILLDDNLRDQLLEKLPDIELKKRLLETRNITLAQVLEKTRASEAAGQQVKHMAGVSDVNAVGRKEDKTNDQSGKTCFSCGKAGHFSLDPCCPAKGRKCSSCSMYGHFAVCCRNLDRTAPETGRGLRPNNNSGNRKAFRRQTNQVEDYVTGSSQEEENPAFAFTVMEENEEGVCNVSTARHVPTMNVSIDGIGHVRYVSPRREGFGSNTPSRGRVVAGGTLAPASSRHREKMEKSFPLIFFRCFVSEMILTCRVSICIIYKYGNCEIFTQSEEGNGSRHL